MSYPILGRQQAREVLCEAFAQLFGRPASRLELAVLLGWSELQTKNWHQMAGPSAWNWGMLEGSGDAGFVELPVADGTAVTFKRFRAYSSPVAGCLDWLSATRNAYPSAFDKAHAGDATGFTMTLVAGRYPHHSSQMGEMVRQVVPLAKRWISELNKEGA